jgi:hypothetical protein
MAGRDTTEFGMRVFWEVERNTNSEFDPNFCETGAARRKTDPVLDSKIDDDISGCFSFVLSGVTSVTPKLEDCSAIPSGTQSKSRSDENATSFKFSLNWKPLAFPSLVMDWSIPLITLYGDKDKFKPLHRQRAW